MLPPDINESEYRFSALDSENSIRYGLSNIKNVASSATEIIEKRDTPYVSFADFSERTQVSIDSVKNLILAGCFDRLYRKELLTCRNDLLFEIGERPFDKKMSCLVAEKNVLSAFLSVNPMDGFMSKHRVADVKLVDGASYVVSGVITSTAIKRTKVKRAEFSMFDLDDGDGVLTLAFFPSPYKTDFSPCIKPNERVQIKLKCAKSKDGSLRLNIEDIRLFGHGVKSIILHLQDERYGDYQDIINGYKDNGGVPLFVKVGNGTPYKNGVHIKPAILDDSRINKSLTAET